MIFYTVEGSFVYAFSEHLLLQGVKILAWHYVLFTLKILFTLRKFIMLKYLFCTPFIPSTQKLWFYSWSLESSKNGLRGSLHLCTIAFDNQKSIPYINIQMNRWFFLEHKKYFSNLYQWGICSVVKKHQNKLQGILQQHLNSQLQLLSLKLWLTTYMQHQIRKFN